MSKKPDLMKLIAKAEKAARTYAKTADLAAFQQGRSGIATDAAWEAYAKAEDALNAVFAALRAATESAP